MDYIKQRKIIDETKDFQSFDYECHRSRFDEITSYLLSSPAKSIVIDDNYNEDKRILLNRELFYAATISFCFTIQKSSDEYSSSLLQETFQKLSNENWTNSLSVDSYDTLNLLHYYMRAFRAYDDKKYPFHYATIADETRRDGSNEIFNDNEINALLMLGKDNLLAYCRSQRKLNPKDKWIHHELAEIMYQLDLANTDEIFDLCRGYILDMDSTNMTFDLARDDAINAKAIDFLIKSLETHLPKVENFLVHHMEGIHDEDIHGYISKYRRLGRTTYLGQDQLESLCSAYMAGARNRNNLLLKQMFMPSILDDNKTRFETAMEIFAAQLRFSRFTSEFKNYSEMEATIKKFIHSYLNDFGVRIKFLQHVREQLEMKMDLLETFEPEDNYDLKKIINLIDKPIYPEDIGQLDELFKYMLTFFGYEFKSENAVKLDKWLADEKTN